MVAVAIVDVTPKRRLAGGDTRGQIASVERSAHTPGDLVDIWYDPFNGEIPGWRGPAQIGIANNCGGNTTAWFQGRTLDRRHQEVRAHIPCLVYLLALVSHKGRQWNIVRREAEILTVSFITVGVVFRQFGWHVNPRSSTFGGRRFLGAALFIGTLSVALISRCHSQSV